ncbi:hypothetical protein HK100_008676 [Physocladia obscura]|uniref:Uncharacterized protein n=1 Tax=Physocladia obscura TaxID=109957 RepID=A0AAD5T417_9FUNG|nr:hypothetical protein HK100_008676 [Physocladia obscura]
MHVLLIANQVTQATTLESVLNDKNIILEESEKMLRKATIIMELTQKEEREVAVANFEKASHDVNSIQLAINRDSVELSNLLVNINELEWVVAESAQKRAEVAEICTRLCIIEPDNAEEYYSRVLERAVKLFYKLHVDLANVKAALESIGRAHNLMKPDLAHGSGDVVDIAIVQDMIFSLHFLDLAHTYWPDLKIVKFDSELERLKMIRMNNSNSTSIATARIATARLRLLRSHIVNNQVFLDKEGTSVIAKLKTAFEKINILSKQLFNARFRVLENRLLTINDETPRNLPVGSRDILFRIDKRLLENVVNDTGVVSSEEEIGRAVGLNYGDYDISSPEFAINTLPPDY